MKKFLSLALVLAMCAGLAVSANAAGTKLSTQNLTVDGESVDCAKYNIDGYNYFKLRDLAALLDGTKAQFSVDYDADTDTVTLVTGEAYAPVGGELEAGEDLSASSKVSAQNLVIDGIAVDGFSVYNIGGNNYFQLRELSLALNYYVDYDAETRTAEISTVYSYTDTYTYDAAGNLLTDVSVDVSGLVMTTTNTYENGLLLSEKTVLNDGEEWGTDYVYDEAGLCVGKTDYGSEGSCTYAYTYDDNGNPATDIFSTDEGVVYTVTYTCDAAGNILTMVYAPADGDDGYTDVYTYDAAGNMLSDTCTFTDGNGYTDVYTYDANGNVLTEKFENLNGVFFSSVYTYDAYGNLLTEVTTNDEDTWNYSYAHTLDAAGNPLTTVTTLDGVETSRDVFTYDANGNVLTLFHTAL